MCRTHTNNVHICVPYTLTRVFTPIKYTKNVHTCILHCNTLQRTATYSNTVQHTAPQAKYIEQTALQTRLLDWLWVVCPIDIVCNSFFTNNSSESSFFNQWNNSWHLFQFFCFCKLGSGRRWSSWEYHSLRTWQDFPQGTEISEKYAISLSGSQRSKHEKFAGKFKFSKSLKSNTSKRYGCYSRRYLKGEIKLLRNSRKISKLTPTSL